mmetsp:Transcript_25470/g.83837  ORF Transcript_25470/g.83837 Transcript_25470/m.83837 type:complete len:244 (+) Transcript_25470:469-1200(+)
MRKPTSRASLTASWSSLTASAASQKLTRRWSVLSWSSLTCECRSRTLLRPPSNPASRRASRTPPSALSDASIGRTLITIAGLLWWKLTAERTTYSKEVSVLTALMSAFLSLTPVGDIGSGDFKPVNGPPPPAVSPKRSYTSWFRPVVVTAVGFVSTLSGVDPTRTGAAVAAVPVVLAAATAAACRFCWCKDASSDSSSRWICFLARASSTSASANADTRAASTALAVSCCWIASMRSSFDSAA